MERLAYLLAYTARGDRAAFHAIYESTSAKLFGVILLILKDRAEAEDVLHDSYVRIWQNANSYNAAIGRPMAWLITIARYGAIDRVRRRSRRVYVELDQLAELADTSPAADVLLFASRDAQRMSAILGTLQPHVISAIRSIYFDGLSYEELAASENIAVGTIKSRVRRGLLRMRAMMILQEAA